LTVRDQLFGPDAIALTRPVKKALTKRFHQKHKWFPGSHDRVLFTLTDLPTMSTVHPVTLSQQISQLKDARVHADYDFTLDKLRDIPYDTWLEYADHMVAFASQLLPVARLLPSYNIT
jgi:hypothetical protein